MSEIKLKPLQCPLCSAKMKRIKNGYEHPSSQCVLSGFVITDVEVKKWNTRKPMERIVERVEEARQKYQRLQKEQGEKEDEAINILFRGMMNIVKEEGESNAST